MAKRNLNRLAGIPQDVVITDVSESGNEFTAAPGSDRPVCPYCKGSSLTSKGNTPPRVIYHTPRGNCSTLIHISFTRFYCKDCDVSFTHRPDWIHPCLPITGSLFVSILADFSSTKSMREIAADNCVSEGVVRGIFNSITISPSFTLVRTLCVDEFRGNAGTYNSETGRWQRRLFQCNIVDGESHSVIDVLPSRDYQSLKEYFMQYPLQERQKVEFLCCDMHAGFAKLRNDVFPNSTLCIDRFHVVQLLNRAVDSVRIQYQKGMRSRLALNKNDREAKELYGLLKGSSRLLTTKESNLLRYWEPDALDAKMQKLSTVFAAFPDLREVYNYLQEFHVITSQENGYLLRTDLTEWIDRAESSEVESLRHAAATIRKWKPFILNGLRMKRNNAACEGMNRKIKEIKRNASGYKNFDNFRKRILLACGPVTLTKEYSFSRNAPNGSTSQPKGVPQNEKQ